jgi:spore coat polysaccharide biosynthesis protein SpsF
MSDKKYVATIEARMSSSRLPGKVLLPAAGKPMLQHLFERLKQVDSLSDIVLATTVNQPDDVLEDFAREMGMSCFRGSEDDVLSRVIGAAEQAGADVIVEISGDCPLIDPELISQCIEIHKNNKADFVSNATIPSYPGGMDVSIFSLDVLKKSEAMAKNPLHREHVCLNIVEHQEIFSCLNVIAPPKLHWPELHVVLDEHDDYKLICHLFEHLGQQYPCFDCYQIIDYIKSNPEIRKINAKVNRKGAT